VYRALGLPIAQSSVAEVLHTLSNGYVFPGQGQRPTNEFARGFRALGSLHRATVSLPDILNRTVDILSSGKATLHVEHELRTLETHLDRASNRLSLSLIIASIVVGSSIVTTFHAGPHYAGISLLGLAGFVASGSITDGPQAPCNRTQETVAEHTMFAHRYRQTATWAVATVSRNATRGVSHNRWQRTLWSFQRHRKKHEP
jgi:hypothetical protein